MTFSRTKIPSVILLLVLGFTFGYITDYLNFEVPDFSLPLKILGTLRLILIVLEGALEIKIDQSKIIVIIKTFLGALFSIIAITLFVSFLIEKFFNIPFKMVFINILPLIFISRAIAIPI